MYGRQGYRRGAGKLTIFGLDTSQVRVGVTDRAVLAVLSGARVRQVTASRVQAQSGVTIDVAVHVLVAVLAANRVEVEELVIGAVSGGVGDGG